MVYGKIILGLSLGFSEPSLSSFSMGYFASSVPTSRAGAEESLFTYRFIQGSKESLNK